MRRLPRAFKMVSKRKKIVETGNPLREGVLNLVSGGDKKSGAKHFKLSDSKPIVFIMGGSLGAASMNKAVRSMVESMVEKERLIILSFGSVVIDILLKTQTGLTTSLQTIHGLAIL